MPVNYQEIYMQIDAMARKAHQHEKNLQDRRDRALRIFREYAAEIDLSRNKIDLAQSQNSSLRCAVPLGGRLDDRFGLPASRHGYVLLAADGSQVIPDRHGQVDFGLVNVGVIRICDSQPVVPQEIVTSRLLSYDDLYIDNEPVTVEIIALMRDLAERRTLAHLAAQETSPVVTLTDGGLELFRDPKESNTFVRIFNDYLTELERLADLGAVTAGYVDRPRSDLLIRLLELFEIPDQYLGEASRLRPLFGVRDTDLFRNLLAPGERSAVFMIQSQSTKRFKGVLTLHIFYLNVGSPDFPCLVRVEIPAWVADNPALLDLLHATLVSQCRYMGSKPFPYAIHRAHEIAVITHFEKQQLENMISVALHNQGFHTQGPSNKQFIKNNST